MLHVTQTLCVGVVLAACTANASPANAQAAASDAETILKAIEANEANKVAFDPALRDDPEASALHYARENLYVITRVKLIGDLWRAAPEHEALVELMAYRWSNMQRIWGVEITDEVELFARIHPNATDTIADGWYSAAEIAMSRSYRDFDKQIEAAESFIERYPDDHRGAQLLSNASRMAPSEEQRAAITKRIVEQFPESPAAKQAKGELRRFEAVGKPFELAFDDHISGNAVSMADYKGKVVVIDFWATWCGPCVAELPHLKELYMQYHDSGLEVIGISLDENAQTVIDYCNENEMPWAQYCEEGKVWDTELSTSWGISGIPTMFIVDRKGILRSVTARGQLDRLIPELLQEPM